MNYQQHWERILKAKYNCGPSGNDIPIRDTHLYVGMRSYSISRDGIELFMLTPAHRNNIFSLSCYACEVYSMSLSDMRAVRALPTKKRATYIKHINDAMAWFLDTEKYSFSMSGELLRLNIGDEWLPMVRAMRFWSIPIAHSGAVERQMHNPRPEIELEPEPQSENKRFILSKRHATAPKVVEKSREGEFSTWLDKEFTDAEVAIEG